MVRILEQCIGICLLLCLASTGFTQSFMLGLDVVETSGGLRVTVVRPGSAATRLQGSGITAALEPGDVLVRVNGQALSSVTVLQQALASNNGLISMDVHDVSTGVVRAWSVQADRSEASSIPMDQRIANKPVLSPGWSLGLTLSEVRGAGLRVEAVLANGPATQLTLVSDPNTRGILEPNDLIVNVNGTLVDSITGLQSILQQNSGQVRLTVRDVKHGDMQWYARAVGSQSDSQVSGDFGKPITSGLRQPRKPPDIARVP